MVVLLEEGRCPEVGLQDAAPATRQLCRDPKSIANLTRPADPVKPEARSQFFPADSSIQDLKPHFEKSHVQLQTEVEPAYQSARDRPDMAAIGSLVFCTDCGNLLDSNTGRKAYIQCDICGTSNKGKTRYMNKTPGNLATRACDPFGSTLRTRFQHFNGRQK